MTKIEDLGDLLDDLFGDTHTPGVKPVKVAKRQKVVKPRGPIARKYFPEFKDLKARSNSPIRDLCQRHPAPPRVGPDLAYLHQHKEFIDDLTQRRLRTLEQLYASRNQTTAVGRILCSIISAQTYEPWAFELIYPEVIYVRL